MSIRGKLDAWQKRWKKFSDDSDLPHSAGLAIFSILILVLWRLFWPAQWYDYRVEFVGLIFDIVFVLIIFRFFEQSRQRKQDIKRQEEIIEDYKRWNSEEARFRLAGAIRRLNKLGVHKLHLIGIRLSNFEFSTNGIRDISESIFYDGSCWESGDVMLEKVCFDRVRCRKVQFSPFNPFRWGKLLNPRVASFVDCSFVNSDLTGASFNGAHLIWTRLPPESHFEHVVDDELGLPVFGQVSYGAFDCANLAEASFVGTHFQNADFRNAENIEKANFKDATGLDTCIFDSDALRNDVLREAMVRTG